MPVSRALIAAAIFFCSSAWAIEQNRPIHYSADRQLWSRRENRVELIGNATVRQPGETLTANTILLDLNARTVDAKGDCYYSASDTIIHGEEMHFNLDSHTGSIVNGRVSNERFSLSGERINKLGPKRFQTHWGEYSTCRDCPQSWAFQAEDVDMEFEGYAYLSNVTVKIKDAPSVWFPYLVVPLKTQRQTGLLFPRFSVSDQNGAMVVLPFFWAISRSADMTFGLGEYTAKGRRLEWEGRYALGERSNGKANFYYLMDRSSQFQDQAGGAGVGQHRWALDVAQTQELPFGIEQKLRLTDVSDNLYPTFIGDVPGDRLSVLESDFILSSSSLQVNSYVAFRRFRNLFNTDPDPVKRLKEFDSHTVQAYPQAAVTTNDRFLFGTPIATGLTVGLTNFTRTAGPFDYDETSVAPGTSPAVLPAFTPGRDPIRKATRFSITPSLYTTLRPFDVVSLVPSLTYYGYFYSFHGALQNLSRGYLHFQADLSTQLERIYSTDDSAIPLVKHLIRPMLRYSYIPYVRESDPTHKFLEQINFRPGYNFDNNDIVPLDATPTDVNIFSTSVPLGNSLSYGFTTQLIRRRGALDAQGAWYQRSAELAVGQALNFMSREERPLSRLFTSLNFEFDRFISSTNYSYTPYVSWAKHALQTSMSYVFERGLRDGILVFDRSVSAGYVYNRSCLTDVNCGSNGFTVSTAFSLSDFILPVFSTTYDLIQERFSTSRLDLHFQSPSRCWKFTLGLARDAQTGANHSIDLVFNLTGSGFTGISEFATQTLYK